MNPGVSDDFEQADLAWGTAVKLATAALRNDADHDRELQVLQSGRIHPAVPEECEQPGNGRVRFICQRRNNIRYGLFREFVSQSVSPGYWTGKSAYNQSGCMRHLSTGHPFFNLIKECPAGTSPVTACDLFRIPHW